MKSTTITRILMILAIIMTFSLTLNAQVQLSMALTDEDEEIVTDPEYLCKAKVDACLTLGIKQKIQIAVENPERKNISLDVRLSVQKVFWRAKPTDIVNKGWVRGKQLFEVTVDLSKQKTARRAALIASVKFQGNTPQRKTTLAARPANQRPTNSKRPSNITRRPTSTRTQSAAGQGRSGNLQSNPKVKPNSELWVFCMRSIKYKNNPCSPKACPCKKLPGSPMIKNP